VFPLACARTIWAGRDLADTSMVWTIDGSRRAGAKAERIRERIQDGGSEVGGVALR
jgi:hypothetical protein